MGMSISAKLIYGLEFSNVPEDLLEEVEEALDSGELDYASPYYDADKGEWLVGIRVRVDGLCYTKFEDAVRSTLYEDGISFWHENIPECFREMEKRGLLYVYVSPHVY